MALADIEKIEFGIVDQPTFQVLLYLSGITLPLGYKYFSGNTFVDMVWEGLGCGSVV